MNEDKLNAWRESQHEPPVRLRLLNGVPYMLPSGNLPTAVIDAKQSKTPEEFEKWLEEYTRQRNVMREAQQEVRETVSAYNTGKENLQKIQSEIAQIEAKLLKIANPI